MAKTEAEIAGMGQAGGVAAEVIDGPEIKVSGVVEVGSVKPGMIPTLLEGRVLESIHNYISRDTRNEQGGFVIFHVETNPMLKRQVARVKDFMPSHLGQTTGVSFQWTPDDFSEANRYVDRRWPGSILGFIHSHPGMSVGPTGETRDSFILKGFCKEPSIPFLIYNPINRTINDLRWDAGRNQAVSVGGILIDQAGLSQESELQFVDTDFFGGSGRSYKATLVPSGKSLEESIKIGEVVPAKGEEIARWAREDAGRRAEVSSKQRFSTLVTQVQEQLRGAAIDSGLMRDNLLELFDVATEITTADPSGEQRLVRSLTVLLKVAKVKRISFSSVTAEMTAEQHRADVGGLIDEVQKFVAEPNLSDDQRWWLGEGLRRLLDHTVALGNADTMGTSLARLLKIARTKQVKLK